MTGYVDADGKLMHLNEWYVQSGLPGGGSACLAHELHGLSPGGNTALHELRVLYLLSLCLPSLPAV